jgi:hypothetical protein
MMARHPLEHCHDQKCAKRAIRLLVNSLDFCIKRSVCGTEGVIARRPPPSRRPA